MTCTTLCRSTRFFSWLGRRKSRYRYFRRRSSFGETESSIWNGGVSDSERIRSSFAISSIFPVFMFGLTFSGVLAAISPRTASTYSLRMVSALANRACSAVLPSMAICTRPVLSRRAMNISCPRSRLRCTQPITVTSCPIIVSFTSQHIQLLFKPVNDSPISFILLSFAKFLTGVPVLPFIILIFPQKVKMR